MPGPESGLEVGSDLTKMVEEFLLKVVLQDKDD